MHALSELGRSKDGLPLAEQAVAKADAIGDPSLRAAARVSLGSAQASTGDVAHAIPTLQTALQLAEANHDDRSAAQEQWWTGLATMLERLDAIEATARAVREAPLRRYLSRTTTGSGSPRPPSPRSTAR